MADSIRGDGLLRLIRALAALHEDPELLNRARARFSASPPSYRSEPSGTPTRSPSPEQLSEAQQRHDERKWRLIMEHGASIPYHQFDSQYGDEVDRLMEAGPKRGPPRPAGMNIHQHAEEIVRNRWIEQGIWREEWDDKDDKRNPGKLWKHEDPPKQESRAGAKRKRPPKTDEEMQREGCEREASRPYYQFMYQVSKEREWIQDEIEAQKRFLASSMLHGRGQYSDHPAEMEQQQGRNEESGGNPVILLPHDINSTAYERVKSNWMRKGIWNMKWGVLPGMSWKHEQPLEEMLREELGDGPTFDQAKPSLPERAEQGPAEALRRNSSAFVFGTSHNQASVALGVSQDAPCANGETSEDGDSTANPSGSARAPGSNRRPGSGNLDSSIQEPPPGDPRSLLTDDETSYPPAARIPRSGPAGSRRSLRSSVRQRRQRGATERCVRVSGGSQTKHVALAPVQPLKASKTRKSGGLEPRGRRKPGVSSPEAVHAISPDAASATSPRRSKRLQEAKGVKIPDTISASSRPHNAPRTSRRTSTGASKAAGSLKPGGVAKRRSKKSRRSAGQEGSGYEEFIQAQRCAFVLS